MALKQDEARTADICLRFKNMRGTTRKQYLWLLCEFLAIYEGQNHKFDRGKWLAVAGYQSNESPYAAYNRL